MKIKIKINEAIETVGRDAIANREAEEISNNFDADKMDQEIEARENRTHNIKKLGEILQTDPKELEAINILLKAHKGAINPAQEFNVDLLFETIKKLLRRLQGKLANNLGLKTNKLAAASEKLADELENHSEKIVAQRQIGSILGPHMGPSYDLSTNENLDSREQQNIQKIRKYIDDKEKETGKKLKDEEYEKILRQHGLYPRADQFLQDFTDIKTLIKQVQNANGLFDKQMEKAINKIAKGGKDVAAVLIGSDGKGTLLNNLKSVYIITQVIDTIAKEGFKFVPKIAKSYSQVEDHPDLATAIDNLNVSTDKYIKWYRKININNVIDAASDKFNDRIGTLVTNARDTATGSAAARADASAATAASSIEVGTGTSPGLNEQIFYNLLLKEGNLDNWKQETKDRLKLAIKDLVIDKFPEDPGKTNRLYKALDDAAKGDKIINLLLTALKPYIEVQKKGITYNIAVLNKPIGIATNIVANKIANQEELNKFEKQYYINNSKEVEEELKKLNINEVLIKENCVITNNSNVDVSQLENIVARFYPYVKQKLNFNKDAKLNLVSDPENSKDPWGKTAYYNPNSMEITVFVDNRHPKDMLRSISHELVHHAQNCRGEFDQAQALEPGYAQKDPHMRRMEGEAYLLGNGFLVRDFEDYLKSQQNQNLTENKKMKGLTNEQLQTVLENTIKRVMKEGSPPPLQSPTDQAREQGETPGGYGGLEEDADYYMSQEQGSGYTSQSAQSGNRAEEMAAFKAGFKKKNPDGSLKGDVSAWTAAGKPGPVTEISIADYYADETGFKSGTEKTLAAWEDDKATSPQDDEKKEKVVKEKKEGKKGKYDDGDGKDEKCDHVPCNETFTSKKDQLLFERLTNKWTK